MEDIPRSSLRFSFSSSFTTESSGILVGVQLPPNLFGWTFCRQEILCIFFFSFIGVKDHLFGSKYKEEQKGWPASLILLLKIK